jgi:hypothetical protein
MPVTQHKGEKNEKVKKNIFLLFLIEKRVAAAVRVFGDVQMRCAYS